MEMVISALLAATLIYLWQRLKVMEAVRLMDLQRNRVCYRMDDQLKTQKQIAEFIEKHK
jgi:hypothetical protein